MEERLEDDQEVPQQSTKLSILVAEGVAEGIRKLARRNRRTLSAEVGLALEAHLERQQRVERRVSVA